MQRVILITGFLLLVLMSGSSLIAQQPLPTSAPNTLISTDRYIRSPRLGINHISSAEAPANEERYRNALLLGAGWNRWPLYWNRVETAPGQFDWSAYDRLVSDDLRHGLRSNAILMGRPDFRWDGSRIEGLNAPIFAQGSDTPTTTTSLNPENKWALFVYEAVQRYKPGGLLAQQLGWGPNMGIRVWEIWNEPDHKPFWNGSISEYARLLKVSYIVIKLVDPEAQVMFGGLLFPGEDNWLARVLAIYEDDPLRSSYNWFMDIVAVHSYAYPWRSGWLVLWVRQTLKAYGLSRPIWVNESGAAIWDDYPGPLWASAPEQRRLRVTAEQQANFFMQSAAYAWAQGADVVFFHQLYDDCGDQPAGTNFPYHNGDYCATGNVCWGDAFGLFRNKSDAACYSQHPFPGTPRPAAAAYQRMAQVFGSGPFDNPRVQTTDGATLIAFDRVTTGERIYVLWNRTLEETTLDLAASGPQAALYSYDNDWQLFPDEAGNFQITLPAATPDGFPYLEPGDVTAVGGKTFILVERLSEADAQVARLEAQTLSIPEVTVTPRQPVMVTPGSVVAPLRPTVDPAADSTPPTALVAPLTETSPATFTVAWSGEDDSGIQRYLIWVRINGGSWQPWLETARTEAEYTGQPGQVYEFAAWALDLAGNWSTNTDLTPQAATRVE